MPPLAWEQITGVVWGERRCRTGLRATCLALLALAVLAACAPAAEAGAPRWVHVQPAASPPAAFVAPMAYDAATKQLALVDTLNGTTWIWDGTTWTPAVPTTRPP